MTKVIIIGEHPEKKELKPIHFEKVLSFDVSFKFTTAYITPERWENIELICKNYQNACDLMFAFDNNRHEGILFLGHFNDGVV